MELLTTHINAHFDALAAAVAAQRLHPGAEHLPFADGELDTRPLFAAPQAKRSSMSSKARSNIRSKAGRR